MAIEPKNDPNANPQVPKGWTAKFDDKYNTWFYVNLDTRESQWETPEGTTYGGDGLAPPPYSPSDDLKGKSVGGFDSRQNEQGTRSSNYQNTLAQSHPQQQYGGYPPQGYNGYPPQGYGGYPPQGYGYPPQGYGAYPQQPYQQQQQHKSKMGAGTGLAMGAGAGLLGGMLLSSAMHSGPPMDGFHDGFPPPDGGDFGGDFGGGDFGGDF